MSIEWSDARGKADCILEASAACKARSCGLTALIDPAHGTGGTYVVGGNDGMARFTSSKSK
jgi:hypothetical protein